MPMKSSLKFLYAAQPEHSCCTWRLCRQLLPYHSGSPSPSILSVLGFCPTCSALSERPSSFLSWYLRTVIVWLDTNLSLWKELKFFDLALTYLSEGVVPSLAAVFILDQESVAVTSLCSRRLNSLPAFQIYKKIWSLLLIKYRSEAKRTHHFGKSDFLTIKFDFLNNFVDFLTIKKI